MTNPWTLDRLKEYIGAEESLQLDFKSSRPLAGGNRNDAKKFIDGLSSHVSAFLNSEGGLLLVGLEEEDRKNQPDIATGLSEGVPRKLWTAQQFENSICDRIHPSVAAYVQVFPITVREKDGDKLQAFAIEVKRGTTAYQAEDKIYYVRRGYSSDPMEDKDIRLRMLSDDRPRAVVQVALSSDDAIFKLRRKFENYVADVQAAEQKLGKASDRFTTEENLELNPLGLRFMGSDQSEIKLLISAWNTGNRTIREYALVWQINALEGMECRRGPLQVASGEISTIHVLHPPGSVESLPLFPDRTESVIELWLKRPMVHASDNPIGLSLRATLYLDSGPSAEFDFTLDSEIGQEFALTERYFEFIKQRGQLPGPEFIDQIGSEGNENE